MKGSEDVQETDGQRQKVHAGKLIHMLSHRLKRQNIIPCEMTDLQRCKSMY